MRIVQQWCSRRVYHATQLSFKFQRFSGFSVVIWQVMQAPIQCPLYMKPQQLLHNEVSQKQTRLKRIHSPGDRTNCLIFRDIYSDIYRQTACSGAISTKCMRLFNNKSYRYLRGRELSVYRTHTFDDAYYSSL